MKTRHAFIVPIVAALMATSLLADSPESKAGSSEKKPDTPESKSDSASSESKVVLADLPAAAQATIKAKLGNIPIDEIEKKAVKIVVYKVEYRKDGMKIEFMVDNDGKLIPIERDDD